MTEMAEAATEWLAALSGEQRDRAVVGGMTDERTTWFFTPTDHGGLPLNEQRPGQQALAMRLVATGLSSAGFATVSTVLGLENVLDRNEGWGRHFGRDRGRDPGMYYLTVFGTPGEGEWAWRFGGHHISLNYTLNDGRLVSATPNFLGANPARTKLLAGGTLAPLGGIESDARTLAASVLGRGFDSVLLHPLPPPDIVTGNASRVRDGDQMPPRERVWRGGLHATPLHDGGYGHEDHRALAFTTKPKGIPGSVLNPAERVLMQRLVSGYLERFPASFSESWRVNLDALHFGYAGNLDVGGVYYRIQDDRLLIEYDNTQDNANHAHTVVRDLDNDFGYSSLPQ
jgi:hypothetical protein